MGRAGLLLHPLAAGFELARQALARFYTAAHGPVDPSRRHRVERPTGGLAGPQRRGHAAVRRPPAPGPRQPGCAATAGDARRAEPGAGSGQPGCGLGRGPGHGAGRRQASGAAGAGRQAAVPGQPGLPGAGWVFVEIQACAGLAGAGRSRPVWRAGAPALGRWPALAAAGPRFSGSGRQPGAVSVVRAAAGPGIGPRRRCLLGQRRQRS